MTDDVRDEVLARAANDPEVDDDMFRIIAAAMNGDGALADTLSSMRAEADQRLERGE